MGMQRTIGKVLLSLCDFEGPRHMCSHSSHRPSPGGEFGISPGIGGYQHHRSSPGAELGISPAIAIELGISLATHISIATTV